MRTENIIFMLLPYEYALMYYLPYELYVLFKENRNIKNVKNIIKQNISKTIGGKHAIYILVERITNDLFLTHIKVKEYSVYQKIKEIMDSYYELLPPWVAFPDMLQGVPRWTQGCEEHYCWNYWIPYWRSMCEEERNAYCTRHSIPEDWAYYLNTFGLKLLKSPE